MRSPAYTIALICALLATLVPVLAIQANLAGIVDWHKPLIGEPVLEPTPPSFVELSTGKRVIAVTKSNVLACLDAKTGDIAWRYKLEDQDPVVSFHLNGESVLLLSGSSGTTARLFSVVTGAVIWERPLHADSAAVRLTTPVHLGTDVGFTKPVLPGVPTSEDGSVVILSDGRRLTKLALSDGQVQWGLDAPGAGSTVLFKQLLVTGDSLHIMALTSGFSETTLTTLSFDVNTARPLGDFTQIPSSIANPSDAHLAATSVEGPARVLWLEHGRIRSAYLSAAGLLGNVKDLLPGKGAKFASILDVRTRQRGFILGKKGNGAVQIIDVRNGAKIVDEFESSHDSNDKSPSVYTARVSETGITFNRVYWSFSLGLAATQTYSISDTDGLVATGFTFPFDTSSHGVILANAVSTPWGSTEWPTILLTTSSGAIQSVTAETPMWTREESLANIVAVKFIDLGERQVEETRQILADENIAQRLTRQLVELKDLPAYIFRFIYRLSSASYKSTLITAPLNATNLHRDQFGFQKLLVAVTKSGKVFALDSSNGHTIWSRNLGITDYTGAELHVEDMWTVREFGDSVNPTLAILATRTRDGVTQTVGFHVDGFTGKISGEVDAHTGLSLGKVIFEGRHEAAFLTAHENCGTGNRVLAVADSSRQVYIFPFCKTLFEKIAKEPGLFFTTVAPSTDGSTLEGHVTSAPSGKSFVSLPTWSIGMTPGETLHSVTPISSGPISSYGRVAGDKSTLYKYLNPHLQVVVTLQHEQHRANVFVVDSVTGKKVYESHIDSVITAKGVKVVMSENWLVFTWLEKEGGRIGSVELYEDRSRDHTPSPDSSAFASNRHVVSEAKYFILPVEVKALGMTVSKFGITAKELVYINDRNQVASIPRRLLDPRRPRGAPTSSDKEEMLVPYDPLIGPEIKRVVSHKYQVLGATTLTSSPALVESTSLLFAHGLDLFLTRGVNPSGTFDMLTDSFNKAQLLLTLAVLSVGLAVAKPAVDRAALKAKWF